ncbi:DEAD/DEAH box helicase family protein [Flavisolibacter sp. BT320]|nr:DEAD/DEAH box helicase family protein [Flavisolibacter longurius]
MPAYFYDPYRYKAHVLKGGTFQTFTEKSYLPLTDEQIPKHLNGKQHIGLYPLLTDNTSWFIAADFDKENWAKECRSFLKVCAAKGVPAYLERSRSGKGGHVWVFFERPYPASKSRKIMLSLLRESDILSAFDKTSSFDRLFPNQDTLSGKGLGNLIALPLHGPSVGQGNGCFIDPETLNPFEDQWAFLSGVKKASVEKLDEVLRTLTGKEVSSDTCFTQAPGGAMVIALTNCLKLKRNEIPILLINYLKEELNFTNTAFIIKKKIGKSTFGTERYFKLIEERDDEVFLPKGFAGKLLRFCREKGMAIDFKDYRRKKESISFQFAAALREHQEVAVVAAAKKDLGVIVAPPGAGKTIIALNIIAEKQQPALIIVHRKQLMEQWIERAQTFLQIPQNEIGKIGQGKSKIGKRLTVATIQTLAKELEKAEQSGVTNAFGTIIIDECHHIPAESYRNTIAQLNSYYQYGLTATPFRKYNDGKLIFIHLGEIIAEIKSQDIGEAKQPKVIIRNTELDVPFNAKTDKFETLSKILVHDSARNKLILKDIVEELNSGKKAVILTERKEHIDSLNQYLKQSYEVVTLSGEDSESSRAGKWKLVKEGAYQALITTGQYFGEGTDLNNAGTLFLVYPFSFEGKLIQYIGRIQRSEIHPIIYDYRDSKIDYLNKLFLKRNTYYRKLQRQATLFDDPKEESPETRDIITIEKEIKVPIESLVFKYASLAFQYEAAETAATLEFEIENDEIRPEFDVLKPYFEKALKSKNVSVSIHAEFENSKLVSQSADSEDIKRINREVIEGMRFRFVSKHILNDQVLERKGNLLDITQVQSGHQIYETGEELLDDLLKNNQFRHYKQLRYLAERHAGNLLKIRFVLRPFSFVFLITGTEQYHIILETLDTEEATYLWHFHKSSSLLPSKLKEIDAQLQIIRNQGRQVFLDSKPENFSRILHDYSNAQKGFVLWKDMMEERLA